MQFEVVTFQETKVTVIEHRGSPALEDETARKLIAWKLANRLLDQTKYRNYGLYYTNPFNTQPVDHRVDFCLSVEEDVVSNPNGIKTKVIPALRCAYARDVGSRSNNQAGKHSATRASAWSASIVCAASVDRARKDWPCGARGCEWRSSGRALPSRTCAGAVS